MNILIVYNSEKTVALQMAEKVSEVLKKNGADIIVTEFSKDIVSSETENKLFSGVSATVVIGGDGTILKVAKTAALHECPVLGINAGRLGYLASVNGDKLDILKRLISGEYTVETRIMLKAEKYIDGVCVDRCDCLNDAVISKDTLSNVIDIKLRIGNDTIKYRADGIIAATPTGSTAYSLSAGGPVVDPQLKCMVLTPVCPHTLVTRSVVMDAETPVNISVDGSTEIYLSCDGCKAYELNGNATVRISISDIYAKFIKLSDVSVYKIFSDKTDNY